MGIKPGSSKSKMKMGTLMTSKESNHGNTKIYNSGGFF